MSYVHFHLLLNHIPIVASGIALLLLLLAEIKRDPGIARAGWIVMVVTAAAALPTYLTGEPAEEAVEHLPGVVKELIEIHEKRALAALIIAAFGGILGLASLCTAHVREQPPRPLALITLLAVLVGAGVMAWTGNAGGKIRHTEIRSTIAPDAGEVERGEEKEEGH